MKHAADRPRRTVSHGEAARRRFRARCARGERPVFIERFVRKVLTHGAVAKCLVLSAAALAPGRTSEKLVGVRDHPPITAQTASSTISSF